MDLKNTVNELTSMGITQTAIAKAAGVSQGTVSDLASGRIKDLSYSAGKRIEALHRKELAKTKRKGT